MKLYKSGSGSHTHKQTIKTDFASSASVLYCAETCTHSPRAIWVTVVVVVVFSFSSFHGRRFQRDDGAMEAKAN